MQRSWFCVAMMVGLAISEPALACRIFRPIVLEDVQYADVVLVGRISEYRVIRDEGFRQQMLSKPNLSSADRERYEGAESLLPDYARFQIEVEQVLVGHTQDRLSVTWDNSTFGEPEDMPAGPFLIALRLPSSTSPPLRGPSATFFPNAEPGLFTLLQAPCSSPFLFEAGSDEAARVRQILNSTRR